MYCRMKIIKKKDYYNIDKLSASLYLLNERQVGKISPLKRGHIESARHTLNHLLCCYEFSPRKKSHNYLLWQLWNGAALNVFMLPSLLILDISFSFFLFTFFIVQKYSINPRQEIIIKRTVTSEWKAEKWSKTGQQKTRRTHGVTKNCIALSVEVSRTSKEGILFRQSPKNDKSIEGKTSI